MSVGGPWVDATTKGVPAGLSVARGELAAQGWNVVAGDTATPVAIIKDSALTHNIALMAGFCGRHGVDLAPHGKTTLSPELIARQLDAGAWGITAATVQQAMLLLNLGVTRVLIANEVVDPHALRWLASVLDERPEVEVVWYVDSADGLALAESAFAEAARAPQLLVELGHETGRTGLRDDTDALQLARAVAASRLDLVGVAGYEGTIGASRDAETVARVRGLLERIRGLHEALRDEGLLATDRAAIVSAGGSVYFDIVAELLGPLASDTTRVVMRSGCYLTHDHGLYESATPAAQPDWELAPFHPALEIWSRVLSRPEPGLVLVDAGRRDLSHDAGLPIPLATSSRTAPGIRPLAGAHCSGLSDQHAFVVVPADTELAVGDLVGLGISHPCTTFDRWPQLLIVDDAYNVTGVATTLF